MVLLQTHFISSNSSNQSVFIFRCSEFKLGGQTGLTLSSFRLACCHSKPFVPEAGAGLIGSRLAALIRVMKWVNL